MIYGICLVVGLTFTIISVLAGHFFGGHGDHVAGSGGHAEAGADASDMPGISVFSPTVMAAFVTAFGGFGLTGAGQAVAEKLDGHALDLLENNFAVRANDEGGVVIIICAGRVFATDHEEAGRFAAPVLERIRHRERVFAQDENGRVGVLGEGRSSILGIMCSGGIFIPDADDVGR